MNGQIVVKTEDLIVRADEASKKIAAVQNHFNNIEEILNATISYWEGNAGDAFRKIYPTYTEEISECFSRLNENPRDLLAMAGIYADADRVSEEASLDLPIDVIG